jgi:hypothetical protein
LQSPRATQEPAPVRDAAAQVLRVPLVWRVPQVLLVPAAEAGRLFARTMRVRAMPTG